MKPLQTAHSISSCTFANLCLSWITILRNQLLGSGLSRREEEILGEETEKMCEAQEPCSLTLSSHGTHTLYALAWRNFKHDTTLKYTFYSIRTFVT